VRGRLELCSHSGKDDRECGAETHTGNFEPKYEGEYAGEEKPEKGRNNNTYADGKTATKPGTLEYEVDDATTHNLLASEGRMWMILGRSWQYRKVISGTNSSVLRVRA
jgi:hypothetical protein